MSSRPLPPPSWCSICQQWCECGQAEIAVSGELVPIGICAKCWRDLPIATKGQIVAAWPLALRLNEAARVLSTALRLAQVDAEQ